jgi:dUTP pyrophosphatase
MDKIQLKIYNKSKMPNPEYQTSGAAAFDIYCSETVDIPPLTTLALPTGLHFIVPVGYEAQLRLRSSAGAKGLLMPNAPGTIDSDYRGQIQILIRNITSDKITVVGGERIAQCLVKEAPQVVIENIPENEFYTLANKTLRSDGGFGSTGTTSPRNTFDK